MLNQQNRIVFIDQLKGFAIILVVMGHVLFYSLNLSSSNLFKIIASFHMPLFIFLSGYMAYREKQKTDFNSVNQFFYKKIITLIFPFLFVGSLYAFYLGAPWSNLFFGGMKLGYWFTWTLFELFCVYFPLSILSQKINPLKKIWIDVFIFVFPYLIFEFISMKNIIPHTWDSWIGFHLFTLNYRYFILGVFVRKYHFINQLISSKNFVYTISVLIFCICFILNGAQYGNVMTYLLIAVSGIFISFNLFKKYSDVIPGGKILSRLGQRSLDIYMIHYFILISCSQVGEYFTDGKNFTLLFFITLLLSVLIILLCLLVSKLIRSSDLLAFLLLGQMKKNRIRD